MSSVEQHYDAIRQKSKRQRFESPAIRLFRANNAVKRILYDQHGPPAGGIHFEMACGKGGDMGKAGALLRKTGTLVAIDLSLNSIIEAKRRLQEAGPDMPLCHYVRDDMTSPLLWRTLDKHLVKHRVLPGTVDSVSCHFALHYAWDTRTHAQMTFWNAAARLKPGGTFVCTIVDWPGLVARMAGRQRIGNDLYSISMPESSIVPETDDFLARPYIFSLVDSVVGCNEYGIPHGQLCAIAEETGFTVHRRAMRFSDILAGNGMFWTDMTEPEREICSLYAAWVFIRK